MSKKRLRARTLPASAVRPAESKQAPKYWRKRLFKCRYTYKGERFETRNWSVKIQYRGRRKTFALRSNRRSQAAVEACELYRALVSRGWEGAIRQGGRKPLQTSFWPAEPLSPDADKFNASYWEQSLIHREYTMRLEPGVSRELSVRIDHAGTGHYFPLGTDNHRRAARAALRIYQTIASQGWEAANKRYSRELTVAFRWFDSPLAWTYTTVRTQHVVPQGTPPEAPNATTGTRAVAILEPAPGIRRALEWCVTNMDGFRCAATFASAEELLRELRRKPVRLVLVSHDLADQPGHDCVEAMKAEAPGVAGLLYSAYEDSEELFRATPGGAGTYLLRRLPPTQFLAPITGWLSQGRPPGEGMAPAVWRYFKDEFASMPVSGAARELPHLTRREHEVLGLLSKGHPDKDIADRLDISVHTVHEHVRNIFDKLGAHNRTEAAVKFLHK